MKDWKDRIKGDYSDLRGVCHNPKAGQTKEEMAQQLEYAARLNLNAVRFWMSQEEWEKNPEAYEKMLLDFTDSCAVRPGKGNQHHAYFLERQFY